MRAKIMLLSSGKQEELSCAYASRLLTDISSAFGHSFSLAEGKMEAEAFAACQDFRAVFAGSCENPAFQDLLDELGMPLLIRSFCVPESLCARREAPAVLYVATVLSLDEETMLAACRAAFQFAQEQDCRLWSVFPTNASSSDRATAINLSIPIRKVRLKNLRYSLTMRVVPTGSMSLSIPERKNTRPIRQAKRRRKPL